MTAAQGVQYENEIPLMREGLEHKVPTFAIHISWDHLSSKRRADYRLSGLIVWNDWMKQDAITRFGYCNDQVYIAGGGSYHRVHARQRGLYGQQTGALCSDRPDWGNTQRRRCLSPCLTLNEV